MAGDEDHPFARPPRSTVSTPSLTRCSQINLQHCKAATALLGRSLVVEHTDVCLIQEPWIYKDLVRGISLQDGDLHFARGRLGPRTCIFTRKGSNARGLTGFCQRDLVAVILELVEDGRQEDIVFCSAYFPSDSDEAPPTQELQDLVQFCRIRKLPLIVGCDANAQNRVWGSKRDNHRGTSLLEYLVCADLEILNRGSRPTFVTTRCQEVIDLTLCDRQTVERCVDWRVDQEDTLSDHRRIIFNVKGHAAEGKGRVHRNPRAADWSRYKVELESSLGGLDKHPSLCREERIESAVQKIHTALIDSFYTVCPERPKRQGKKVAWWNGELSRLRKASRKLWNTAYRTKDEAHWSEYRNVQRDYKKLIRTAKEDSWRSYCNEMDALPQVARLRRVFSSGPAQGLGGIALPNGGTITQPEKILEHLITVHFPDSVVQEEGEKERWASCRPKADPNWELAARVVSMGSLRWAVDSFDKYKSPGPDGIYPVLLQEGGEALARRLLPIFRACIALGYTPRKWREVRVVFIPKPGKCNYDNAKAFRPISLSSFLLKTLERLVDRYIKTEVLAVNPIYSSQHAYQAGKSTETALHSLVCKLEDARDRKEEAIGVFIDIEGAFDNTSFSIIERAAHEFGIDKTIVSWIVAMLRTRVVTTSFGGTTVEARVGRGCPQGGVISPLLWLLVVNGLLRRLEELGVSAIGYADDVAIVACSGSVRELHWKTQRALNYVETWCTAHGLRVNPGKTEMVHFTRRRIVLREPLFIFNSELGWSSEVKYLGVWLDAKLSWKKHILMQCGKVTTTYWACRRMFGSTWGLKPKVVKWIYSAILLPQLLYAAVVWWTAMSKAGNRRMVDRIGRLACLGITGALRTTPTLTMEALLYIEPPHKLVWENAVCSAARMRLGGAWRGARTGHASVLRTDRQLNSMLAVGGDVAAPVWRDSVRFEIVLAEREAWKQEDPDFLQPKGLIWYTDGSKKNALTGAGIWSDNPKTSVALKLEPHATALQTELAAIRACARLILERSPRGKHLYICSDSKRSLRALLVKECRSRLLNECIELLNAIAKDNWLKLVWVPGHVGIRGNSEADNLARNGGSEGIPDTANSVGVLIEHIKICSRERLRAELDADWISKGPRHSRALLEEPTQRLSEALVSMERDRLRTIIGLVTGHWPTSSYLTKIGRKDNSTCRFCGEMAEEPLHLITRCTALRDTRRDTLGTDCMTNFKISGDNVRRLYEFARKAKILAEDLC